MARNDCPGGRWLIPYSALRIRNSKCQGDHGRCRANYRCCLPALAGFVSPQSMGPGENKSGASAPPLQDQSEHDRSAGILPAYAAAILQTAATQARFNTTQAVSWGCLWWFRSLVRFARFKPATCWRSGPRRYRSAGILLAYARLVRFSLTEEIGISPIDEPVPRV